MYISTGLNMNFSRHQGLSLAELLVSMAVGMIVLVGIANIFISNTRGNTVLLKSARMNQDIGTVMTIMNNEFRRAGYNGGDADLYADEEDIKIVNSSCALYSYDYNQNGVVDDAEKYGYKLTSDVVQMRTSCNGANCFTDCSLGTWQDVTDVNVIIISGLTFTSTNSKCQNTSAGRYWITTGADAIQHPCQATGSTNLTVYDSLVDTSPGSWVAPTTGQQLVETRQVNVAISATLETDSDFKKNLSSSVRLRNDKVKIK